MNLTDEFQTFAGREVPLVETGQTVCGPSYALADQDDPTVRAMEQAAEARGLDFRLNLPGDKPVGGGRADRVNAYIEKADDGKWRVANDFKLG